MFDFHNGVNLIFHKNIKILSLALVLLIIAACNVDKTDMQKQWSLAGDWHLMSDAFEDSIPASVPGNVYLDMQRADIIADPYFADNAESLERYSSYDYRYSLWFEKPETALSHTELLFAGIDTRADVLLNGDTIGKTNNMFRSYRFPVQAGLKKGENHLEIIIHSPTELAANRAEADSLKLPEERAYLRKAPFQWGWDWSPDLPGCGIWKPVHFLAWNDVLMEHVSVQTTDCDSTSADMELLVYMHVDKPGEYTIKLSGDNVELTEICSLQAGNQSLRFPFSIKNPQRWYPNGMGEAHLYQTEFEISNTSSIYRDSLSFGVRTIELRRETDSIGESFEFVVNGCPVFVRGANYVPQDVFLQRSGHQALLEDAVHAGFNMLRVWGGGIYESDRFYALCDSLGIMVWQDFMFACTLYPGDDDFFANVKAEVIEQTERLAAHPAIALWCGNNEVKNAWYDWGWQDVYGWNAQDSAAIWNANRRLFEDSIPAWIKQAGADGDYLSSSPVWGWGHPESLTQGDNHYWGVWWGDEPFESYYEHTGRFMSEFGFQAYPGISSIEKFTAPQDRRIESPVMQAHQKHPFGDERIREFVKIYTGDGDGFKDYAMRTQMLQARGIGNAIRWFRVSPRCAGSLYWQFNDSWPAISWSSRDYYGGLKALHYTAKRAHKKDMLFARQHGDAVVWYAISDADMDSLQLEMAWMDFYGNELSQERVDVNLKAGKAFLMDDVMSDVPENALAHASLLKNGDVLAYYTFWPQKPANPDLPEPSVAIREVEVNGSVCLEFSSDVFVPMLILDSNMRLSDNAFSLIPGKHHLIKASDGSHLTEEDVDIWMYASEQMPQSE